jgi:hypothetical protein
LQEQPSSLPCRPLATGSSSSGGCGAT